jgi:hypothetical protein
MFTFVNASVDWMPDVVGTGAAVLPIDLACTSRIAGLACAPILAPTHPDNGFFGEVVKGFHHGWCDDPRFGVGLHHKRLSKDLKYFTGCRLTWQIELLHAIRHPLRYILCGCHTPLLHSLPYTAGIP